MSPPASDRPGTLRRQADVIATSAWLGWQIDANWADPFTFLVFSIAKPLATSLILYFMVRIVSPASATGDAFLFLFLGNTFFLYVTEVMIGISWAVFRDRELFDLRAGRACRDVPVPMAARERLLALLAQQETPDRIDDNPVEAV